MVNKNQNLSQKKCVPCEGGLDPLNKKQSSDFLKQLNDQWQLTKDNKKIYREYKLKNYYEITSLINLIIWVSHQEDHHPEITFAYNNAKVTFYTYAINGLSENDFICAAKIDKMLKI